MIWHLLSQFMHRDLLFNSSSLKQKEKRGIMMSRDLECYKCSRDIPAGVRGGVSYNLAQMRAIVRVFKCTLLRSRAYAARWQIPERCRRMTPPPPSSAISFANLFSLSFSGIQRRGEFSYKSRRVQRSTWTFTAHHPDGAQHREPFFDSIIPSVHHFLRTPTGFRSFIAISLEN